MWSPVLMVVLGALAVATAIPTRNQRRTRYNVQRPQTGGRSLQTAASQFRNRQFTVRLDDDDSREQPPINLGNLRSALGVTPVAQGPFAGSGNRFNVRLDDDDNDFDDFDSRESNELLFRSPLRCPQGQLPHGNRCVVPRINRNIFVFGKEEAPAPKSLNPALIPLPEIDYNIIFVRSRPQRQRAPVVIPPPQKKTVVYVLEDEEESAEDLLQVPGHPDADPEVYYVKVKPGENPQLPGGIDLQTAYSQAIRPLQGIDDSHESSIEHIIGAGGAGFGGNVGVPLPNPNAVGGAGFGNVGIPLPNPNAAGGAGFGVGDVGVPLPNPNAAGGAGFGLGEPGVPLPIPDGRGAAGPGFAGGNFGVPLPNPNSASGGQFNPGFNVGVPLPTFNGASNNQAASASGGFASVGVPLPGFNGPNPGNLQAFANAGRVLDVDIDDGRLTVEVDSQEVIQQALRYNVPREG